MQTLGKMKIQVCRCCGQLRCDSLRVPVLFFQQIFDQVPENRRPQHHAEDGSRGRKVISFAARVDTTCAFLIHCCVISRWRTQISWPPNSEKSNSSCSHTHAAHSVIQMNPLLMRPIDEANHERCRVAKGAAIAQVQCDLAVRWSLRVRCSMKIHMHRKTLQSIGFNVRGSTQGRTRRTRDPGPTTARPLARLPRLT